MAELPIRKLERSRAEFGEVPSAFSHLGESSYYKLRLRLKKHPSLFGVLKQKDSSAHEALATLLSELDKERSAKGIAPSYGLTEEGLRKLMTRANALVMHLKPLIAAPKIEKPKSAPRIRTIPIVYPSSELDRKMLDRLQGEPGLSEGLDKLGLAGRAYLLHIGHGALQPANHAQISAILRIPKGRVSKLVALGRNWIRRH